VDAPLDLLYSELAVMIGLVYGELPFMILPLYASLEKLDLTLLEAASDLGSHHLDTFRRVTLPLTMPGIVAGVVLVSFPASASSWSPTCWAGPRACWPAT
jgi:ABC-type spermidine/putrescine transport system permease subunit I